MPGLCHLGFMVAGLRYSLLGFRILTLWKSVKLLRSTACLLRETGSSEPTQGSFQRLMGDVEMEFETRKAKTTHLPTPAFWKLQVEKGIKFT